MFVREHGPIEMLHPRPGADVGDGVFALVFADEVIPVWGLVFIIGGRGKFAREADFEYADHAEGFVGVALDCVWNFGGGAGG